MEINTDMSKIKDSKCFGIAWDGTVKECKICDVSNMCKQKTMANIKQINSSNNSNSVEDAKEIVNTEEKSKVTEKPKKAKKEANKTSDKEYQSDMPDFKPMTCEELIDLAKERGIDVAQFDKYTSVPIKKMRLTMALKQTYQVK